MNWNTFTMINTEKLWTTEQTAVFTFKNGQTVKNLSVTTKYKHKWRKWFYCWGWKFITHANSDVEAVYHQCFISKRERKLTKKKKKKWRNWTICDSVVSVQVQIYYNIYYYTAGLHFMSLVQQSQRKTSSLLQQWCQSKLFFLSIGPTECFLSDWLTDWLLIQVQLIWVCYTNIPSFSQTKC